MAGLLVDAVSIIAGSFIGLLLKKGISKKISDAIMIGIGLCVVYMGITGLTGEVGTILLLFSVIIGTLIGTAIDIDARINALALRLEKKFVKEEGSTFAKGSSHALFYPAREPIPLWLLLMPGLEITPCCTRRRS